MATLAKDPFSVTKQKRNDEPAKIDAEVLRVARAVAALRNLTLAEYLSERLRPLVLADHAEEVRKVQDQHGDHDDAPPPASRKRRPPAD